MLEKTVTNTSCPTRCPSAREEDDRRFPVQVKLANLHLRTIEEVVHHFCGLNFRCDACADTYCPELIFEITGLSSDLLQKDLDILAFRIFDIFERRYTRIKVFTFSENNCGFFKIEQTAEKRQAVHVA